MIAKRCRLASAGIGLGIGLAVGIASIDCATAGAPLAADALGPGRWLMFVGGALILVGILVNRWAGRHDLKGAAMESAWTMLRGQRTAENPTAIEAKLREIHGRATWTGKAAKTATTAARHFLAQIAQTVAMFLMVGGLVLAVGGFFWR